MAHFCIDPQLTRYSTAEAPADDSNESLSVVVGWVGCEERPAAVALAGVLSALFDTRAHHVRGHVGVHVATVPVRKDSNINLLEMSH